MAEPKDPIMAALEWAAHSAHHPACKHNGQHGRCTCHVAPAADAMPLYLEMTEKIRRLTDTLRKIEDHTNGFEGWPADVSSSAMFLLGKEKQHRERLDQYGKVHLDI